jgi:hypothetical protein
MPLPLRARVLLYAGAGPAEIARTVREFIRRPR